MARNYTLEDHYKPSARVNSRWSEPAHCPLTWHSQLTADFPSAAPNKLGVNIVHKEDMAKHIPERYRCSPTDSYSSLEKSGLHRSETRISDYSLDLASRASDDEVQRSVWRASFLRIGPILGLIVCISRTMHKASFPQLRQHGRGLFHGQCTEIDLFVSAGTTSCALANSCFVCSLEDLTWPACNGLAI